jgi:hypothetical protein
VPLVGGGNLLRRFLSRRAAGTAIVAHVGDVVDDDGPAAVRSGDVTAIRRVSARNDLVETSRHPPLSQYLGPMARLNIDLAA